MNQLLSVLSAPWAIAPDRLAQLHALYVAHAHGEHVDLAALEARLGRPLDNDRPPAQIVNGSAIVPVDGVLAKKGSMFSDVSGITSMAAIAADLATSAANPAAHSIILAIDSPGGTVDGTVRLAAAVKEAGLKKPVYAHADGVMASAAYWIGSAAGPGRVFIADATTQVGSIGILKKHLDISAAQAAKGVRTTEVAAGKYKRITSEHAPLSAEGLATIQADVDYAYSLFVDAVAANRGVSSDRVLRDMADGRVFRGQQAVDAGLVDGITSLESLVSQLAAAHASGRPFAATPSRHSRKEATVSRLAYSPAQLRAHFDASPDVRAKHGTYEAFVDAMEEQAAPQSSRPEPTDRDREAAEASALAAKEGISFAAAFTKLGFVYGA